MNNGFQLSMEFIFLYFVDSKATGSFGDGVKPLLKSYYLSCGESPWEGKQEADDDNITTDDENEERETSDDSKTQEMVR